MFSHWIIDAVDEAKRVYFSGLRYAFNWILVADDVIPSCEAVGTCFAELFVVTYCWELVHVLSPKKHIQIKVESKNAHMS